MHTHRYTLALAAALLALSWSALAGNADCQGPNTPQKIEGKITNINMADGKVTVKSQDGKVHVFQAAEATLKEYKIGDSITMTLRCQK
jgi:hypothetical protein